MNCRARTPLGLAALLLCAAAPVHDFLSVAISPDGARIASIEGDEGPAGTADIQTVVIRPTAGGPDTNLKLPCGAVRDCTPSSLAWSPDGQKVSFILRTPGSHAHSIYTADAQTGALTRRLAFNGTLESLSISRTGQLAVLATPGATKEVGAVEAGAAQTGELGAAVHEQRLATLQPDGTLRWASPPDLFVYEYSARPDGAGFVGTAAPGDGDNNWWVAKLYAFDAGGTARVIYTPATPQQQLAQPKVSPDGRAVSFIAGLMSDFGATGGEAVVLPLDPGKATAANVTPHWPATVMSLDWACDGGSLLASVLRADKTQVMRLSTTPQQSMPEPLSSSQEVLKGDGTAVSTGCRTKLAAAAHESYLLAPEIEVGEIGRWHDLTHANAGQSVAARMRSLDWTSDGHAVQGWLLLPDGARPGTRLAMITEVHGGPAWANRPRFVGHGYERHFLDAGYALFLPNPRGSYGQGEPFTQGNVRDFGYGDLRDILAGVDAAERAAPIDDHRLGLTGWSYGGYMTMFAVTQTNRFAAAVAGAGIANWQSYYGENGIDAWMIPYFGASVYADPAVYAKSSPMTFIRQVRTPTLAVVRENDIECPAPQTMEFWHALRDLGVPTSSVVYAGEGHRMRDPGHLADFQRRALSWFDTYLRETDGSANTH